MARVRTIPGLLHFFFYLSIIVCCFSKSVESVNLELNEENWREILEGEWMVEFYAPWCPACTTMSLAWNQLATRAERMNLGFSTGAVDVTKSPGLTGRFVVTALPTIFHVKDGEFRQYKGPRDSDAMLSFVEQARWKQVEPVSSWKAPHSMQMTLVAEFFKFSQALRSVHHMLMQTYGLPTWGSYLIFAVATIFIGALLGLVLVCAIDLLYPQRRDRLFIPEADLRAKGDHDGKDKSDDDQELLNEDIVDDAEEENESDAEKNSASDSSDDSKGPAAASGDSKLSDAEPEGKPAEVRKRRPRKAD